MIVKCPECATGYSIPENLVTDKPKKMRCSRCKHVFTLVRRAETAPSGYEEFTGSQHLPSEFAFLRAAPPEPPAAPEDAPPAAEPPAADVTVEEGAPPTAQDETDQPAAAPAADAPVSAAYYAGRYGAPRAPEATPAPRANEAWEEEVPLELEVYSIPTEQRSRGAQAFGKLVFVLIAIALVLFGFVLIRNDFSLSLSELDAQISFAFSGGERDTTSEEARYVDAVVKARTLIDAAGGGKYLVVTGDAFNRGFTGLGRIILRGRLVTAAQETAAEVRAPCGKMIDDETIKMTPKGAMPGHYRSKNGELYNCVISANGSTAFQMVFQEVPPDWEKSLTLEIKPVAAQMAD
jgi:predicted Zn finger-like uncharacterized protein